ncbi:hypothetical protein PR048_014275 [Dryococelus australis]|uniref:YqaJ viral recombinase domain-containing protein n=1 Tax=Dryococelus australis TaxID=614101 RepID=A0ABQ9HDR2_9NEOP|nr:hypothetical protein PR048_014275 [Dryococelus australis]
MPVGEGKVLLQDLETFTNTEREREREERLRPTTSREKAVTSLLHSDFSGCAATKYDLPWLAATPDGLVGNNALVEVKCPVTARNLTPQEAVKEKKLTYCILIDDHLYLKENHPYSRAGLKGWEKQETPRENHPTSSIVHDDSHMRKSGSDPTRNQTWFAYVGVEQHWNARMGETGEPRENQLASGIIRHDSHNVTIRERPHRGLNPVALVGGEPYNRLATTPP